MIDNNNALICNMEGKVLYFGLTPFLNRIVNSDGCFICGDRPEDKEFNNEHIIPKWLLRKHNLFNKNITLPNGTAIPYSNYKIPCCKDCNSDLSRMVENPISLLLSQPYNDIVNAINTDDSIAKSLYHWLCLIYIKTHLKDNLLPIERDRRKNTGSIGDYHYWEAMHHVHCMARKHYTNAIVDQEVYGTIFILPSIIVNSADKANNFDYADHSTTKTVMLQTGDFCIIAVLNDARACYSVLSETMKKITGPLTSFQIRDLMAHINYISLNLKEMPVFHSTISYKGEYKIVAEVPDIVHLKEKENRIISHGELLHFYTENMLGNIEERDSILNDIRAGIRNYLFNEDGSFIDHSKI